MVKLKKGKFTYGKSISESLYWKVDEKGVGLAIGDWSTRTINVDLQNDYAVGGNTYECGDGVEITRREFLDKLKEIKNKVKSLRA